MTLLEHALDYAAAGWEIFPVNPQTKAPLVSQYDATVDAPRIGHWWREHPTALIGHRLPADVVIVDIDPRHGGDKTWRELRDSYGSVETRAHYSGRGDGGGHVWWRNSLAENEHYTTGELDKWARGQSLGEDVGNGRWTAGIDVLQRFHRFTILPPSPHPDTGKPYRWRTTFDAPVADLPGWLHAYIVAEKATSLALPAGESKSQLSNLHSESPIEWVNRTQSFSSVLGAHGWTLIRGDGERDGSCWRHPQATAEWSASVKGGCLYVHTPNTPFEPTSPGDPHGYDVFDCWRILNGHGSSSDAARKALELRDGPRDHVDDWTWLATPGTSPAATQTPTEPSIRLPDEFWQTRQQLLHIRQAAYSRMVAPDAVLASVAAIACSRTSHTIDIPAIVGRAASINLLVALLGPTGGGKSAAVGVAEDLMGRSDVVTLANGSGEGLAEAFMGSIPNPNAGQPGEPKTIRCQTVYNAFVYVDEGDALLATGARSGATILPTLRTVGTGGRLGEDNATAERKRRIPRGMYRIGYVIGFQEHGAAALLDDAAGGLPGRFLFATATDPTIPRDAPEWPGLLPWEPPGIAVLETHEAPLSAAGLRRHELDYTAAVWTEVRDHQHGRATGQIVVESLDGHAHLTRLKLAAMLALLEGRMDVTDDDWQLASIWWDTSCRVRATVIEWRRNEAEKAEQTADERAARRALSSDVDRQIVDCARRLRTRLVNDGSCSRSDLRRKLSHGKRAFFEPALEHAIGEGWITEQRTPSRSSGTKIELCATPIEGV